MEQFGTYFLGRDPLFLVFRKELRRTYECRDEPLPSRLEELVRRFASGAAEDVSATCGTFSGESPSRT